METIPLTIIGGGVVGLAIANELIEGGERDIVLLDKNRNFGEEQSARNSGVIHCGMYYTLGSLMAQLCVQGFPLLYEFARRHDVPAKKTGNLFVATTPDEEKTLDEYLERSIANGVEGIKKISRSELKRREPNVEAISALFSQNGGIISSAHYINALERKAQSQHNEPGMLKKQSQVIGVEATGDGFIIYVRDTGNRPFDWSFKTEVLINAAGLYAVDIAKMINPDTPYTKYYMRGEFFTFDNSEKPDLQIAGSVYPAPKVMPLSDGTLFPDWGIHLTPTFEYTPRRNIAIGNTVLVGPAFTETTDPKDTRTGTLGKQLFYDEARKYFPNLRIDDLKVSYSGVLGMLREPWDFVIYKEQKYPNCIQLLGMESPALTASLAIAKYVAGMLQK